MKTDLICTAPFKPYKSRYYTTLSEIELGWNTFPTP